MRFPEFPLSPPGESLIGIARLASQGELLQAKSRVQYKELPTRRYITPCASRHMPFSLTINPYRGCEFGCKYCYARYTHEFLELREIGQFENEIFAKQWNAKGFSEELNRIPQGKHIAIGTATDPYQPAERRYGITRKMLQVIGEGAGLRLSITTKSDLIARDAVLLANLARRHVLHIHITITTLDTHLARLLEPRAPRPDLRLSAVQTLAAAGISVGVFASPILPHLNDVPEDLRALAVAARQHGATHFWGSPVFLRPCASSVLLPFLARDFPRLAETYQRWFGSHHQLPDLERQRIQEAVHSACHAAGLSSPPTDYDPPEWPRDKQLDLFSSAVAPQTAMTDSYAGYSLSKES